MDRNGVVKPTDQQHQKQEFPPQWSRRDRFAYLMSRKCFDLCDVAHDLTKGLIYYSPQNMLNGPLKAMKSSRARTPANRLGKIHDSPGVMFVPPMRTVPNVADVFC